MDTIKDKLSAMGLWKKSNRDSIPKYSIVASIATTIKTVAPGSMIQGPLTVNEQSILPDPLLTLTSQHNAVTDRSNLNVVHQGLTFIGPITAAVPIAGTPLKASIDTLLVMLDSIKTRSKNREDAVRLTQRLRRLDGAISSASPGTPSILQRRNELARKLDRILDRLKRLHVKSFLRSGDIKQAIVECITEIDEHLQDYFLPSQMQMETMVQVLFDNQGRFPISMQQDTVFVRDATGREYKVLVEQCQSHKQFMRVLASYFEDTNRDEVLRGFINREAYEFYIEDGRGISQLERWGGVQAGARIIMTAVFEQSYPSIDETDQYRCPRPQCQAWNDGKEENNGWINWWVSIYISTMLMYNE
ncbi:hypothetical protein BDP27DRAFT_1360961 [Rhodocollybia butyracea]|uniref:Ubiquitin-like domain-containing protein n=1 Tax=Rhodocollybia butyracea TaxID=206335 RepID=A0A9P5PZA0_9AGAR|nr:hypothetical protein BDP27DRAFT_1360961 [Rhodocollybia butyracea]